MSDYIKSQTRIVTVQAVDSGATEIPMHNFMLSDVLISNLSEGRATLVCSDEERTHVIQTLDLCTECRMKLREIIYQWLYKK